MFRLQYAAVKKIYIESQRNDVLFDSVGGSSVEGVCKFMHNSTAFEEAK